MSLPRPPERSDVAEIVSEPLRRAVERRLAQVRPLFDAHAGGVELLDVSGDGAVRVRFTGLCTGCTFRPLTMAATLRPALLAVPGVTRVESQGSRISAEAEARIAHYRAVAAARWPASGP